MLRVLDKNEVQLVSGGMMEDGDNYDGGGGGGGGGGFEDGGFAGTSLDLSNDSGFTNNGDAQMDFSQDENGDIVVVGERNMPSDWSDSSWAQIGCKIAFTAAGENDFESDLMCRVDWSGDNPSDPKNANRLGEIMKSHSDEFFGAVDKVQRGVESRYSLQ